MPCQKLADWGVNASAQLVPAGWRSSHKGGPLRGAAPEGAALGEALAVAAARPDDEPQAVPVAEPERSAVPVPVGGGEGGGGEGAATGRHAATDAAPRYSVSSEAQGVGAEAPLGQ